MACGFVCLFLGTVTVVGVSVDIITAVGYTCHLRPKMLVDRFRTREGFHYMLR